MCGIVGIISKNQNGFQHVHTSIFTEMLLADILRGSDSTGCFGVTRKGIVEILKADVHAADFIRLEQYDKFKTRIWRSYSAVIGHNRSATFGKISADNAHPFKDGNITLVHNGTISNSHKLKKNVEVDSMAIAHTINSNEVDKALESIDGPFALGWHDEKSKTINLARNNMSGGRPLHYIETSDAWIICSEPILGYWILARNRIKAIKYCEVPLNKIVQFNLEKLHSKPKEISYENFKYSWKPSKSYESKNVEASYPVPAVQTVLNGKFKAGDLILVKFDDYETQSDIPGIRLLGNPVFSDQTMDKNIQIRAWFTNLQEEAAMNLYCSDKILWSCIVHNTSFSGKNPIVWVNKIEKAEVRKSANNFVMSDKQFTSETLKNGCHRCNNRLLDFGKFDEMGLNTQNQITCPDCWKSDEKKIINA